MVNGESRPQPMDVGAATLTLANEWWEVTIRLLGDVGPSRIVDRRNGLVVADAPYCYALEVPAEALHFACRGLVEVAHRRDDEGGGQAVTLEGRLDFGKDGPTDIHLRHRIALPADGPWLEEQITLQHRFGRHAHRLEGLRFGLRKMLFDRERHAWADGMDRCRLVPVPHRRRFGHRVDRRTTAYTAADLFPLSWDPRNNLPDHGSEAWLWCDGERGVLVAKYNREAIELGRFDGELLLPSGGDRGRLSVMDAVSSHVPTPVHVCARFAGAGLYRGDPEAAQVLGPEAEIAFGATRLVAFQGDWQEGYAAYRAHLRALGHGVPPGFDPPLHWNELYNLGWRLGDNAPLQTRAQLEAEAAIAADIGAEALYLDPTWDLGEGSTIWDTARLGPQGEFARLLRERYNLSLSLHLMMHTTVLDEDPAIYLRDAEGNTAPFHLPDSLYPNARVCCASAAWKDLKKERLLALAEAGATFFMFDFLNYNKDGAAVGVRQIACHDSGHGHAVPLTRQGHAEGVFEVIQAVKRAYPQVLIEAHDRVNGGMQDYHQVYFQHGLPHSFDSNWGFEYMWDPYYDLLSGKALSLYEYNLACDIPLYLHIHEGRDSTTMLAFWWYASTCRHLGIGGVSDPGTPLYAALKQAVDHYRRLKPFFTQGDFVGIDQFAHIHALPGRNAAVCVLFNLGQAAEERTIALDPGQIGLASIDRAAGGRLGRGAGGRATLTVKIPPLSPLLVELNMQGGEAGPGQA